MIDLLFYILPKEMLLKGNIFIIIDIFIVNNLLFK